MKLAFFDAKPYDRPGFDAHAAGTGLEIRYFETKLGEDTVQLARGFDCVCVFVNDTVNAKVADELYRLWAFGSSHCGARASTMWIRAHAAAGSASSVSRPTRPTRWRSTRWRCC